MSTFITRLETTGTGPRVAVKDLIDVEGIPTTAGCRALERIAKPAERDAPCLAGARAAGARLVGKTNLHELAMLPIGTNPWFGNPVNPLDGALIPGGSSSGSAVAVANDDADVALGSDTGGSVRIPAACCGIVGLKTTHGRIPLEGVWPLAPSLDTIGPMARTIDGLRLGMELLEPGFTVAPSPAVRIGRLRTAAAPEIEAAIDAALAGAGFDVVPITIDLDAGTNAFTPIYFAELWEIDGSLIGDDPDGIGADIKEAVGMVEMFVPALAEARTAARGWKVALDAAFAEAELLALPTLPILPPTIEAVEADRLTHIIQLSAYTSLFNVAGVPCTAQPVPIVGSRIPASLQLVGPARSEELLLPTARRVEQSLR